MTRELSDQELKDYARWLMYDHVREIDFVTIHEFADIYFVSGFELTKQQARRIDDYIQSAEIAIIVE